MKRTLYEKILLWYQKGHYKNLWLYGCARTGKSYLVLDFLKKEAIGYCYIDLSEAPYLRLKFAGMAPGKVILDEICAAYNIPDEYISQLVFVIDDLEFYPEVAEKIALTFTDPNVRAILISRSACRLDDMYYSLKLFPVSFEEYLHALDKSWYVEVIRGHFLAGKKVPGMIHLELLSLFDDYLDTGSLPEAIEFRLKGGPGEELYPNVYKGLKSCILEGIQDEAVRNKCENILESICPQLNKANKKFKMSMIREGLSFSAYKDAFDALEDQGAVKRLYRFNEQTEDNTSAFRLYPCDPGLIGHDFNTSEDFINADAGKIKKLKIESLLLQQAEAEQKKVYYWESGATASIDFIELTDNGPLPYEIKAESSKRSKSLNVFKNRFNISKYMRISDENYIMTEEENSIPYYALICL